MYEERTDRNRELLNEAERLLRSDPAACLRLLDRSDLLQSCEGNVLWLRGQALMSLRRHEEALPVFESAIALAKDQGDVLETARLQYAVSGVYFMRHDYDGAQLHASTALDTYGQGPEHPPTLGKILIGLGHLQYIQGHFDRALGNYHRAVAIFDELRDLYTLGALYSGLVGVYAAQGDLEMALQYARLRVSSLEAVGDARGATEGLAMLAMVYREGGELEAARVTAREAVKRGESLNSPHHEATARSVLASIYLLASDVDAASREAQIVIDLTSSDADPIRTEAIVTLAGVAELQGKADESDALYQRVLDALPNTGNTGRLAEVALAYSQVLEKRGDTEGAVRFARLAAQVRTVPGTV